MDYILILTNCIVQNDLNNFTHEIYTRKEKQYIFFTIHQ